jgi:hypothetical protein
MKTVPDDWRKSSRSTETNSCVEVSRTRAAVRDSKNPGGPVLPVSLDRFLAAVKAQS